MSLMWIPAQTTVAPLALARSATGTSSPTGAKTTAASIGSGGGSATAPAPSAPRPRGGTRPGPLGAQPAGDLLALAVPGAREGEHAATLVDRDLAEDVGGGAEAVEAD